MNLLDALIGRAVAGGGSAAVTPADIVSATGDMDFTQQAQTRTNIGAAAAWTENTVPGTTVSILPLPNNRYECGEITSLTISVSPPEKGEYSIVFTSGATPTTTTIPHTILGLESFAAEANTLYEINVLDNRAVVGSWAVSSGE